MKSHVLKKEIRAFHLICIAQCGLSSDKGNYQLEAIFYEEEDWRSATCKTCHDIMLKKSL